MIGRTLGNYRVIEQIGLGGMATVFKAYDPDMDRFVAIKILPQQFSNDPQFKERFHREAKAIAKLEHIHILPIFAYGEEDGIAYMVMRYLQGGTLTDRIAEGALPFDEASRLLDQLASALDHAHTHGILHRDMKPSNVLLDDDGNAYLMDFGIAKIVESTVDLTGDRLLGTPAYMSPEQCSGEPVGPATDIYALGIILYEMMTARRPFHAETPVAVILQQLHDPLPPPRNVRPDLPEKAENVIYKALAKKPASRYQTAGALAAAFARAISEADTAVAGPPLATHPSKQPTIERAIEETAVADSKQRIPVWVWGLIGVVVIGLLIGGGFWLHNLSQQEEPTAVEVDTSALISKETSNPAPAQAEAGQILFFEEMGDSWHIYVQNAATEDRHQLAEFPKSTFTSLGGAVWSPDGQKVLFSADPKEDKSQLYTINLDGTDLSVIFTHPELNLVDPAWSPDGEWLAMHASCSLLIARVDGGDIIELINPNENERCASFPVWSPDSQQIAYTEQSWDGVGIRMVRVISRDGRNLITLATYEEQEWGPNEILWSPDGTQIAFIGSAAEGRPTYLINGDGSGEPQPIAGIPPSWQQNYWPRWSSNDIEFVELPEHETEAEYCQDEGELLFFNDFEDGSLNQWDFFNVDGLPSMAGWEIVIEDDGNHVLVGNEHAWAHARDTYGENYSFHLRLRAPDNGDFHVNFRMGENGRYYMTKNFLEREPASDFFAQWDALQDDRWHDIHLVALDNHFEVFADGRLLVEVEDLEPVMAGIIALENINGTVLYDDILLCSLDR